MRLPQHVLLDTDLLIAAKGKDSDARKFVLSLQRSQLVISAITAVEFAVGERGIEKRRNRTLSTSLAGFTILDIDRAVYLQAMREATRFGGGESGKLKAADLIIACTAIVTGRTLLTRNTKDFEVFTNMNRKDWSALV
jgi:predicted nucleic acid-binding protein